jgi:uncharacterized protein YndB with AHSA1/START domain/uncharacterized protein YciI
MSKPGARAIADVTTGTILASVEIAVPPERVFRALTESSEVTRWWGSEEAYQTTGWTADVRKGGKWRGDGTGQQGPFHVEGEYLEVDPPRKLVQTWRPSWDAGEATKLTYLLEQTKGGTRLTVRHEGFGDRADSCRDHGEGWVLVLGWLSKHLAPAAQYFFCRLLPPRATFVEDITPEEVAVMQAHAAYWREHLEAGSVVVFGPVLDPKGAWGLGVVCAPDEAAVRAFAAADPAMRSERGFRYEVTPMSRAVF